MKRTKLNVVIAGASIALAASAVALAETMRTSAIEPYTVTGGTPVRAAELGALAHDVLAHTGGVRAVSILGTRGDHAYYRIATSRGDACFAMGQTIVPRQFGILGCLAGERITLPLIDMSTIVVDPRTGSVVRVARVEGIAADQVARVAIEANGVVAAEMAASDNVYRFDESSIPSGADAVLALDSAGAVLWRKPLGSS